MSSYGSITYTDVLNQVQNQGWKIVSQTPDSTVIEKPVGIPGVIGIPLAIIPFVGFLLALAWIALRGKAVVTIERKLTQARLLTPRNEFDVNHREDLELFFNDYNYSRNVGYFPITVIGLVILFVGGVVLPQLGLL